MAATALCLVGEFMADIEVSTAPIEGTVDGAADYLVLIDTSEGEINRILPNSLPVSTAQAAAIAGKVGLTGNETVAGTKTFSSDVLVPDEAYDATAWNGSLEVPTKNAVRDKIETLGSPDLTAIGTDVNITSDANRYEIAGAGVLDYNVASNYIRIAPDGQSIRLTGAVVFLGSSLVTYVLNTGQVILASIAVPGTASSTGTAGEIRWDATHWYVCVATNTWVRTALSTW